MGFRVVQRTQSRTKPVKSAIIVFDNDVDVIECPTITTENIAVAVLKTSTWKLGVVSIYFEDSLPIEPYLTHLRSAVTRLGTDKVIIGGDANAWSAWWGSDAEDYRGETLAGAIEEMEFHVLNEGTVPTFFTVRNGNTYKSIVDITVCSHQLLGNIQDWKVDQGITSSDHNAITFTIKLGKQMQPRNRKSTRKFNSKKANWGIFSEKLQENFGKHRLSSTEIEKVGTATELEELVEKYMLSVDSACKEAIPLTVKKLKSYLPWWSAKLNDLKRQMTTKKRRIRCACPSRRQHVVDQYLKAKEEYELEAAKAQIESWKKFCGTQDREGLWDGIYRVIRKTSKQYEDQPLAKNGVVLSVTESAKLLSETFFPDDLVYYDSPNHTRIRMEADLTMEPSASDTNDPPFTIAELMQAAVSFNPKKAPGADGFTADICLAAVRVDPPVFLGIMNACLRLSHFPIVWKKATVIALRKPGKEDYSQPKSYRPIGLLPVFGKILEKAMVKRLRWHLLPRLNPRQYGFVPQRCTEDSLYDLIQHIRGNLKNKKINVIVSLDIEGAFDSAWWPAIKCRIKEKGCPFNLRKLVNSYLKERTVCIRYAGEEVEKPTTKGCVQGSIGGPTLWNVLLDPLLDLIVAHGVHCQAFADDIVLVFSGDQTAEIEVKAAQVLHRVYEWGMENKLKFAPHKTHGMVITRKLKYDTPRICMGNALIQIVNEIKILGLTIDSKLTFNSHVREVCKKAINIYKPMARSAKINWGLCPEIIRTMYKAVIEPIILYAASAWAPAAEKITVQKQLSSVQRGFAQKICKAYRTVSLHAALILTGLLPLDLRVKQMAELYEAKRGKPQDILRGNELEGKKSFLDAVHPAKETDIRFECLEDLEPETVQKHNIQGMLIFTDGSRIEEKVGASLSCWKNGREILGRKFRLSTFCTVFQAELYALYQASITANSVADRNISILSDSRSALELLCNAGAAHPLSSSIKENLRHSQESGKTVNLFWIRAHAGVEGNERADELAKQAAKHKKSTPDYDKCPLSYIKKSLKLKYIQIWNDRYINSDRAKTTKLFFPNVITAHQALKTIKLTPTLVQILTGHGGFAGYLHKYKCKDTPACKCDEEAEESVIHLLTDCPMFCRQRYNAEHITGLQISRGNLSTLMCDKSCQDAFINFCTKLAKYAIEKNKTKIE